jgi:diguanylate cyclase (GGDEF)-like protein/PAS domain S-box-containing protein
MRIRAVALSYMTGAGLLVAVASGTLAYHEWDRLAAVREAESLVEVIGAANQFVETMALERGVYNQVIVSPTGHPETKQRLVTERVNATDAVFQQAFATLDSFPAAKAGRFKEPIDEARLLVGKARARGDEAWRSETLDRTEAARAVLADFVSAGQVLDTAMIRLERAVADINPRLGLMLSASRLSNEMREAAGQRSTILSRYAGTGQKLDPASATQVAELTGSIQGTWERLNRIVRQVENSPKLAAAVDHTRATFMTEGERVYRQMAAAARDGAPSPMEFLQWRAWTVPMLTTILAPRDAPVEQAMDDIHVLRSSAQFQLGLVVSGGAVALLLFLGAGIDIERRVIKPLARLTKALERAAEAGPEGPPSEDLGHYELGDDELGALSRALGRVHQRSTELRRLHERFDAALANLPQGLCVFDGDRRLLVANSRYAEIYGLAREQVSPGTPLETILKYREDAGSVPEHAAEYVRDTIVAASRPQADHIVAALRNGRMIAVSMQPLPDGGWVATHEDVTARYEAEARIAFLANHDALTELPNRVLFRERLTQALSRVHGGETLALLCLDLDEFKSVNDTRGHHAGDRLLTAVAERLVGCVRDSDTVARLGGDEFAILQVGAEQPDGAGELARRIIDVISQPYDIDGQQVVVGTSIGVALAPADTLDADELLKSADVALYRAKDEGRGRYRFFEREMDPRFQALEDAWLRRQPSLFAEEPRNREPQAAA